LVASPGLAVRETSLQLRSSVCEARPDRLAASRGKPILRQSRRIVGRGRGSGVLGPRTAAHGYSDLPDDAQRHPGCFVDSRPQRPLSMPGPVRRRRISASSHLSAGCQLRGVLPGPMNGVNGLREAERRLSGNVATSANGATENSRCCHHAGSTFPLIGVRARSSRRGH
jgi:hypothetical protein